jgi:hypothetical protein
MLNNGFRADGFSSLSEVFLVERHQGWACRRDLVKMRSALALRLRCVWWIPFQGEWLRQLLRCLIYN